MKMFWEKEVRPFEQSSSSAVSATVRLWTAAAAAICAFAARVIEMAVRPATVRPVAAVLVRLPAMAAMATATKLIAELRRAARVIKVAIRPATVRPVATVLARLIAASASSAARPRLIAELHTAPSSFAAKLHASAPAATSAGVFEFAIAPGAIDSVAAITGILGTAAGCPLSVAPPTTRPPKRERRIGNSKSGCCCAARC